MTVEPSAGRESAAPDDRSSAADPEPRASMPGPADGDDRRAPTAERRDDTRPTEQARAGAVRSRTGATWVGLCLAAVVLVVLIVFMLQNTKPVEVHFLGWAGTAPLAVALLIAGVAVGLVALVVGTVRIAQLRRRLGAARKAADPGS